MTTPSPIPSFAARDQVFRPGAALRTRQGDFAAALAQQPDTASKVSPEDRAREAAADFVAVAFIQPILSQLRQTSSAQAPFAPGAAEKQFRGLMDAQLARQISRGAHFPLVDRVARDLLHEQRPLPPELHWSTMLAHPRAGGALDVQAR